MIFIDEAELTMYLDLISDIEMFELATKNS